MLDRLRVAFSSNHLGHYHLRNVLGRIKIKASLFNIQHEIIVMGNFMHTAFKAYCGVLLGPV